jgi:hypothetical protein
VAPDVPVPPVLVPPLLAPPLLWASASPAENMSAAAAVQRRFMNLLLLPTEGNGEGTYVFHEAGGQRRV